MGAFTINSKPYAGDYGGGRQITAIFYEGTITVNNSASQSYNGTLKDPGVTVGTAISKGDYVSLVRYAASTYDASSGVICVKKAAADELAIGRCLEAAPAWRKIPATTTTINDTTTWASALSAGYYRYGLIEIWCQNIHLVNAPTATGAPIVAGDAVGYDVSDAGFVYVADFDNDDSGQYDSSGADTGFVGLLAYANALNSASTSNQDILIAIGLTPVQVAA